MSLMKHVLTLFVLTHAALSAHAEPERFVVIDDPVFGAGAITRDTVSGLDWLDLALTRGYSYAAMKKALAADGRFAGFRHATRDDLVTLWRHFGLRDLPMGTFARPDHVPRVERYIGVFGDTCTPAQCDDPRFPRTMSHGVIDEVRELAAFGVAVATLVEVDAQRFTDALAVNTRIGHGAGGLGVDDGREHVGHYLVRVRAGTPGAAGVATSATPR
ncbi:MAG: hypothetical protein AB7Q81_03630 [Gammaproteobacteria bacterium]